MFRIYKSVKNLSTTDTYFYSMRSASIRAFPNLQNHWSLTNPVQFFLRSYICNRRFFKTNSGKPRSYDALKDDTQLKERGSQDFNKQDLDYVKTLFAEGYLAGRMSPGVIRHKWWKIVAALLSGIFVGFFLPLLVLINTDNTDRQIHFDPKKFTTKFSDVKGVEDAKQELSDIVDYLRRPAQFSKLGGKLPKGVLLVGPPGTGKTLLARALAGEAEVPYFAMSGSEFEQTFVGEGARRVRELFKIAKKNAPCVIFIDEIDSVGSKRINSSMHPHSNQTINQLLTEMDGFKKNEGVIVLAATNRREDLDKALLRPGRFDVEVVVSVPNYTGRKEILEHYLAGITCAKVDIDELARGTVGFTGADLESMVNRSALRAAKNGASRVLSDHLYAERDRILMGPENKSRIPDQVSNNITAYHEGGHCLVALFTPNSQPVHKVTIVSRGDSLGHTAYLPDRDEVYATKAQLLARLDALMGGRAAEEIIFGPNLITSGAASDLKTANELAMRMVARWGMSERIGLRTGQSENDGPAYRDLVDQEVKRTLQESYERAKTLLRKHSREHNLLAEALLRKETLDAQDIQKIVSSKSSDR